RGFAEDWTIGAEAHVLDQSEQPHQRWVRRFAGTCVSRFVAAARIGREISMTRRKFASMFAALAATFARTLKAAASAVSAPRILREAVAPVAAAIPEYRNTDLPIERRTADLLHRMTLEEKVEQLRGGVTSSYGVSDPTGKFTRDSIKGNFREIYAM